MRTMYLLCAKNYPGSILMLNPAGALWFKPVIYHQYPLSISLMCC